jgi:PAS domain S-box-containing protein
MVLAAAAVRVVFWGAFGTHAPFVTFYPAVVIAALLGGFAAGMLATALSALLASLLLLGPAGSLGITDRADLLSLIVFLTSCAILSYLVAVIHRARILTKQAEALRSKYELLADHSRDIILFRRRNDGRILEANAAACTAYGYEREELLKLTIHDLRAPEAKELTSGEIAESDERGVLFESVHRRRDGCAFPVEVGLRGAIIDGEDVLISVVRDITKRKKAEEALRVAAIVQAEKDRLLALVNSTADEIWFADTNRKFTFVNPPAVREFGPGVAAETEVEKVFASLEVYRGDGSPRPVQEAPPLRALAGEVVYGEDEIVRSPGSGELRYREVNSSPVRDAGGNIIGAVSVVRDVTERKRAEEALRVALDRAEWLGRFPEENPSPMVRVSRDGSVLYRNPAAAELPGWACEVGRPAPDALLPLIRQAIAGKRPTQHEVDLGSRLFSVVLTAFHAEGYTNIYGIDITRRKQAEDALQANNEELRTMSRQLWQSAKLATMGELAASIAHEINNPLSTVSLHVESMLGQTGPDEPRRHVLEVVEQEVDRIASLVANLLQFSRRSRQQISTVDVRDEIDKTLELIHYHLRKQRIEVVREFADELPMIQADRQHLLQLFLNLITNASDAMPQGGTLTIRVNAADNVTVEIIDTGAGIAPEDLARVVEPFFTTKPEGEGTGLGLPICRRIAKEHGGKLEIASEPGKGTTVRVVLPTQGKVNGTILNGDD